MATRSQTGGATSAVAASAHAGCDRFKATDPLITGMNRRAMARRLGHPDTLAGIPEARWMRAMTFERLVRDEAFVSPLITRTMGALGLDRPAAVRRLDGGSTLADTAAALTAAHDSTRAGDAALITGLAVPYLGMEGDPSATSVLPDFAMVVPATETSGSWLVMGDAKDYERVRSRIDDNRLLKGFLQVAMGAECAAQWSALPSGMDVHSHGALAVPRNSFLQPTVEVEDLTDHRAEVRSRTESRREMLASIGSPDLQTDADIHAFVSHVEATFDPRSCTTCSLFLFCRNELRQSNDPMAVLIETGVPERYRAQALPIVEGRPEESTASPTIVENVSATVTGEPQPTGQYRIDPVGQPGAIDVVIAKSDSAALGLYGLSVRRWLSDCGTGEWSTLTFTQPQAPTTRLAALDILGRHIAETMGDAPESPVHLVVADPTTADVLVSIADSAAGLEIARLRWQRDVDRGRTPLTFDGEEADIPDPLTEHQRLAVSFLLEADRARALALRTAIVDLTAVMRRHWTVGGSPFESGRLDYLLEWISSPGPVDHREISDRIAAEEHTPGARLSNQRSDAIHAANRRRRGAERPQTYLMLIAEELGYKQEMVDWAIELLDDWVEFSNLWQVHHTLESDAQAVWRRRLEVHASDLVRFGRTNQRWRNDNVDLLESDATCARALDLLGSPIAAAEAAADAGTRDVAFAEVVSINPIVLELDQRRLGQGATVAIIAVDGELVAEAEGLSLRALQNSFRLGLPFGELEEVGPASYAISLSNPIDLVGGEQIILIECGRDFGEPNRREIEVKRPSLDKQSAPKPGCHADSYGNDPDRHRWCCRSHEDDEAETSDWMATQRDQGLMNPEVWPPIVDDDQFDTTGQAPTGNDVDVDAGQPDGLTMDDVE